MTDGTVETSNDMFLRVFSELELPAWVRRYEWKTEFQFSPRRWRFDMAIPRLKLAIEIQGGGFNGRFGHSSAAGITRDQDKCNAAQLLGWIVLYLPTNKIKIKKRRHELNALVLEGFKVAANRIIDNRKMRHGCFARQLPCSECRAGFVD